MIIPLKLGLIITVSMRFISVLLILELCVFTGVIATGSDSDPGGGNTDNDFRATDTPLKDAPLHLYAAMAPPPEEPETRDQKRERQTKERHTAKSAKKLAAKKRESIVAATSNSRVTEQSIVKTVFTSADHIGDSVDSDTSKTLELPATSIKTSECHSNQLLVDSVSPKLPVIVTFGDIACLTLHPRASYITVSIDTPSDVSNGSEPSSSKRSSDRFYIVSVHGVSVHGVSAPEPTAIRGLTDQGLYTTLSGQITASHKNKLIPVICASSLSATDTTKKLRGVLERMAPKTTDLYFVYTSDTEYAVTTADTKEIQGTRRLLKIFEHAGFESARKTVVSLTDTLPAIGSDEARKVMQTITSEFYDINQKGQHNIREDAMPSAKQIERISDHYSEAMKYSVYFLKIQEAYAKAFNDEVIKLIDQIPQPDTTTLSSEFDSTPLHDASVAFVQSMRDGLDLRSYWDQVVEQVFIAEKPALYDAIKRISYEKSIEVLTVMGKFLRENPKAYAHLQATFSDHYHRITIDGTTYTCTYHKESLISGLLLPMMLTLCEPDLPCARVALFHDIGKIHTSVIVDGRNISWPAHGEYAAYLLSQCYCFPEDELVAIKDHMCCGYHEVADHVSCKSSAISSAFFLKMEHAMMLSDATKRYLTALSLADTLGAIPDIDLNYDKVKGSCDVFTDTIQTKSPTGYARGYVFGRSTLVSLIGPSHSGKSKIRRMFEDRYGARVTSFVYDLIFYTMVAENHGVELTGPLIEGSDQYNELKRIWSEFLIESGFDKTAKSKMRDTIFAQMYRDIEIAKTTRGTIIIVDAADEYGVDIQFLSNFPKFDGYRITILISHEKLSPSIAEANNGDITRHASLYGCSPSKLARSISEQKRPHMVVCAHTGEKNTITWVGLEIMYGVLGGVSEVICPLTEQERVAWSIEKNMVSCTSARAQGALWCQENRDVVITFIRQGMAEMMQLKSFDTYNKRSTVTQKLLKCFGNIESPRVELTGSTSKGTDIDDSDIDFMIILPYVGGQDTLDLAETLNQSILSCYDRTEFTPVTMYRPDLLRFTFNGIPIDIQLMVGTTEIDIDSLVMPERGPCFKIVEKSCKQITSYVQKNVVAYPSWPKDAKFHITSRSLFTALTRYLHDLKLLEYGVSKFPVIKTKIAPSDKYMRMRQDIRRLPTIECTQPDIKTLETFLSQLFAGCAVWTWPGQLETPEYLATQEVISSLEIRIKQKIIMVQGIETIDLPSLSPVFMQKLEIIGVNVTYSEVGPRVKDTHASNKTPVFLLTEFAKSGLHKFPFGVMKPGKLDPTVYEIHVIYPASSTYETTTSKLKDGLMSQHRTMCDPRYQFHRHVIGEGMASPIDVLVTLID